MLIGLFSLNKSNKSTIFASDKKQIITIKNKTTMAYNMSKKIFLSNLKNDISRLTEQEKMNLFNMWEECRCATECEYLVDLTTKDGAKDFINSYGVDMLVSMRNAKCRYAIIGLNFPNPYGVDNLDSLINTQLGDIADALINDVVAFENILDVNSLFATMFNSLRD